MSFGGRTAPRWLVSTLVKAAEKTGVDPVYLMTLADVESSLEPQAKAPTSSAEGLFQFIDQTWLEVLYHHAEAHGFAGAAEAVRMVDDEVVVADESKRAWLFGLKRDPYLAALGGRTHHGRSARAPGAGRARTRRGRALPRSLLRRQGRRALPQSPGRAAGRGRREAVPEGAKANLGLFSGAQGLRAARSRSPNSTTASTPRSSAASTATTSSPRSRRFRSSRKPQGATYWPRRRHSEG